jgi:prolyl-tRNA synthetase
MFTRRTEPRVKNSASLDEFASSAPAMLEEIQKALFQRALEFREANTHRVTSLDEFRELFHSSDEETSTQGGFAWCHWSEDPAMYNVLDELRVTIRGVPLEQAAEPGTCIFTGKPSRQVAIFARAY